MVKGATTMEKLKDLRISTTMEKLKDWGISEEDSRNCEVNDEEEKRDLTSKLLRALGLFAGSILLIRHVGRSYGNSKSSEAKETR